MTAELTSLRSAPSPTPAPADLVETPSWTSAPAAAPPRERVTGRPADARAAFGGSSRRATAAIFVALYAIYAAIGLVLDLHYNYIFGDGISRVANASYVIFSRDPHLSAVGFVWNPLPSLLDLPLLLLKGLWPALLDRGVAGILVSSAFMAGTVCEIRGIVLDRGGSRLWTAGLTLAAAFHPMIVLYAGSGQSEPFYLFFTTWAVRRLMRWIRTERVNDLAVAGIALGLDYLTRYESLAVGLGAVLLVLAVSLWRRRREGTPRRGALSSGALDAVIVGFPLALSFVLWTFSSWLITGNALAQFSSQYGNSTIVKATNGLGSAAGFGGANAYAGGAIGLIFRDALSLEPLLFTIVIVAVVLAAWRRDAEVLPPLVLYGAALAFEALSYLSGSTFPWLRFYLMTVPLAVVLVATLRPSPAYRGRKIGDAVTPARSLSLTQRLATGLCAAIVLIPAIPVSWNAMLNPEIGIQEYALRSVVSPHQYPPATNPQLQGFPQEVRLAQYLDSLRLSNGSILLDTFVGWRIFISSNRPHQFVITSDYQFSRDLNDPKRYGIEYILVPDRVNGSLDAVNRRYPTFWSTGAGIAHARPQRPRHRHRALVAALPGQPLRVRRRPGGPGATRGDDGRPGRRDRPAGAPGSPARGRRGGAGSSGPPRRRCGGAGRS